VRDVRETVVVQGTPEDRRMAHFEQKMEAASRIVSSLKESDIQTCPKGGQQGQHLILSSLHHTAFISSGRDCYVTPIQGPDGWIRGLNLLFPEERLGRHGDSDPYATSIERYFSFRDPFYLPFRSQPITEAGNVQFLNEVLKVHCAGLNEEDARRLLPEGMPFDPQVARAISRFTFAMGEIAPFMKRGLQANHPYIDLFALVFPYVIPEYRDIRDRDLNNDNPVDWCTYTHQTCTRWVQDGEGGSHQMNYGWVDFYKWCQERLNRNLDATQYDVKIVEWRERLKNLMRRGPLTSLFDNSAVEEESSDSDEMS